ncbi:hypothetical protein EVAR_69715_1 [Eumeta japonica]|uniref:Uncharacterized protein n=1 Tax=Eumeta variegata TaxID=151549 RepID=A0A4C1TC50_EUMVA|nr:hypothetical protein EVAR_69715_1 [Eumeta japonica]
MAKVYRWLIKQFIGWCLNLVDNLLELVVGLLDALLLGMHNQHSNGGSQSSFPNMPGSGDDIDSLINAPIRINALVNVLSTLKQELQQAMQPGSVIPSLPGPSTSQGSTGKSGGLLGSLLGSSGGFGTGGNKGSSTGGISQGNKPNEICFDVPLNQSSMMQGGNNNPVNSLINLPENAWAQQTHSNAPPALVMRRICIPGVQPPVPAPIPIQTTTTARPIVQPKIPRCFRRTCAKWHHTVDYDCTHNPNEYPKYAITSNEQSY